LNIMPVRMIVYVHSHGTCSQTPLLQSFPSDDGKGIG
jgi:hypothetical protein